MDRPTISEMIEFTENERELAEMAILIADHERKLALARLKERRVWMLGHIVKILRAQVSA